MSSKRCGCGGTLGNTEAKVKAHEKTKKHQNWLASQKSSKPNNNGSEEPPQKKSRMDSQDPANECFDLYRDNEFPEGVITMDGIMEIMEALDFDPASDVRVLVLLWRLQTDTKGRRNPSEVSKADFLAGMRKLGCGNIADLKRKSASFDPGLLDRKEFKEFYSFAFSFSRENKTFKTIDTESVMQLLPIVLDESRAPHLSQFIEFLGASSQSRITFDQWDSFLQFNYQVSLDFSDYDDDGAWPLLFDEYVEWMQAKSKGA